MKKKEWVRDWRRACGSTLRPYCVNGQGPTQEILRRKLSTIMKCVSWVFDDALKDHEWVTELSVILKENEMLAALNCDLDVPCVIRRRLLWFSSPSRRHQTFTNNGTKIAKCHEATNMVIEATFIMSSEGLHTPRTFLLRSISVVLYRSPDKDWNVEEEMKGWGLGESVSALLGRRHFRYVKMQRGLRRMQHHCF